MTKPTILQTKWILSKKWSVRNLVHFMTSLVAKIIKSSLHYTNFIETKVLENFPPDLASLTLISQAEQPRVIFIFSECVDNLY